MHTTVAGAGRLGGNARGLAFWESIDHTQSPVMQVTGVHIGLPMQGELVHLPLMQAMAFCGQTTPQPPQFLLSLSVLISHPFCVLLSQSA